MNRVGNTTVQLLFMWSTYHHLPYTNKCERIRKSRKTINYRLVRKAFKKMLYALSSYRLTFAIAWNLHCLSLCLSLSPLTRSIHSVCLRSLLSLFHFELIWPSLMVLSIGFYHTNRKYEHDSEKQSQSHIRMNATASTTTIRSNFGQIC